MTDSTPKPPAELERRGRAFWRKIMDVYLPDAPHEVEILREICRSLDSLDRLAAQVATDGEMIEGNGGRMRLHPAISASASLRIVVARLVERLGLSAADGAVTPSAASVHGVKANTARWSQPRVGSSVSDAAREAASTRWARERGTVA